MHFIGIIPARFGSTRFPGKPLIDISGKSMIQRVYEQATKANSLSALYVATDDERIEKHVKAFGGNVIMTSQNAKTGTDRCLEAYEKQIEQLFLSDDAIIINIQGDEPFIDPSQINLICSCFNDKTTDIATLAKKITDIEELENHNVVKLVKNYDGKALYFSRHPIPFVRDIEPNSWLNSVIFFKHIGIYAYKASVLKKISLLPISPLEKAESLEQLRWLENGFNIKVAETTLESVSIDTPEDIIKLKF
ncbi:MAG: 3-deoxy-manno-octulosonate cytidylyltransferase [Bacteroidota bacterium]